MEQHGNFPSQLVIAIVPARYESERLPGKMLLPIAGKPLVVCTLERLQLAKNIDRIIAAVDDERLLAAVRDAGFEAVLTSPEHKSGSDRIAEVARILPADALIINVQGDEPLISPETIDRVVEALRNDSNAVIATVSEPFANLESELFNPNVVKVVCGDDGYAHYFSRSPVPFPRNAVLASGGDLKRAITQDPNLPDLFRKHVGIYAYRRDYLLRYASLPQSCLEQVESLEQLRALNDKALIKVVESAGSSIGVDTREDYQRVKAIIESGADRSEVRELERGDLKDVHLPASPDVSHV